MVNEILLNILVRQVKAGNIEIENIKDEEYKTEVQRVLAVNT